MPKGHILGHKLCEKGRKKNKGKVLDEASLQLNIYSTGGLKQKRNHKHFRSNHD